jgi:hypothetical protein
MSIINVAELRKLKASFSRRYLGAALSISGAVLVVACIAIGFYHLAAFAAGIDLIVTRLALGIGRSNRDSLGSSG